MKKTMVNLDKMDIVGPSLQTCNTYEANPKEAKIGRLVERYRLENLASNIPHSKTPGTTYCIYTNYENKERGELGFYTFLIGEQVHEIEEVPKGFELVTIPSGKYAKFTTEPGEMPQVIINAWKQIWQMSPKELGGERRYNTDFEVYDKRAVNPHNTIVDLYIGLK